MNKPPLAACLAAILLNISAASFAEPAQVFTERVRIDDLDLTTKRDAERLEARLAHAIATVCGHPSQADLTARADARRCRATLQRQLESDLERRADRRMGRKGGAPLQH